MGPGRAASRRAVDRVDARQRRRDAARGAPRRRRAAVAAGCDDPLVVYLLGAHDQRRRRSLRGAGGDVPPVDRGDEGRPLRPRGRAPARHRALLHATRSGARASACVRRSRRSSSSGSRNRSRTAATDRTTRSCSPGSSCTAPASSFVRRANDAVSAAIDRATWIDPWMKLHFSGLMHIRRAFKARGRQVGEGRHRGGMEGLPRGERPRAARSRGVLAPAPGPARGGGRARSASPKTTRRRARTRASGSTARSRRRWTSCPAYETVRVRLLPRWGGSHERDVRLRPRGARDAPLRHRGAGRSSSGRCSTSGATSAARTAATRTRRPSSAGPRRCRCCARCSRATSPSRRARPSGRAGSRCGPSSADRAGEAAEAARHLAAAGGRLDPQRRRASWTEGETPDAFARRVVLAASPAAAGIARAAAARRGLRRRGALAAYREALAKDPSPRGGRRDRATPSRRWRRSGSWRRANGFRSCRRPPSWPAGGRCSAPGRARRTDRSSGSPARAAS